MALSVSVKSSILRLIVDKFTDRLNNRQTERKKQCNMFQQPIMALRVVLKYLIN